MPQRALEWCLLAWMRYFPWPPLPPPWPPFSFITRHNPYAVTLKRRGFTIRYGLPQSTYVKYGRVKPDGPVGGSIADDDIWVVEAFEDRPWDDPDPDAWEIPDVVVDRGDAADMSTRYAWQVPKDIPYSSALDSDRDDLWRAFSVRTFFTDPQAHKRGPPAADESRDGLLEDGFDHYDLWLTDRRLRQMGYPDAERLALLSSKYKISEARAKRVRDRVRAEMLGALRGI